VGGGWWEGAGRGDASLLDLAGLRSLNELLQSPRALKALLAAGGVLGLLLIGLLAAPALVRGKLQREAQLRGLEAQVEEVGWGLGRVWLRGVRVTSPGDALELKLDAVSVGVFSGEVAAVGGSLRGSGDATHLLERLRSKGSAGAGDVASAGRPLSLSGLAVRWEREGVVLVGAGVRATRVGGELTCGADSLSMQQEREHARVAVRDLDVATSSRDGHRQLARLSVSSLLFTLGSEDRPAPAPGKGAPAPRGPPLRQNGAVQPINERGADARKVERREGAAIARRGAAADAPEPPDASAEPEASDAPNPAALRAAHLRGLVGVLRPLLQERLAEGANLKLDGVAAHVERGDEMLSFGPSRLSLVREKDALLVSLTPSTTEAGVTPLALNSRLPLSSGPLHAVVRGGPVSLSSLGVQNGQLGLQAVERATLAADGTLEFSEDFESVEVDGKLAVRGLSIARKELSPQPVGPWSFEASLKGSARLDGTELRVTSSEARFGEVRAELSGTVETAPGHRRVLGRVRVPLSGCQSLLDAMPSGLLPLVSGLRFGGSFGVDLQVRYDQTKPLDTSVVLAVQNECRVRDVPAELSPHRFERPFLREVKAPDGSPMTIESGPGTPSWVSLDDISRHMESAILICEDAGFHSHAGFDFRALENAIKDDLKQGRFARGASTVSMQLAKNLYLGKEKTLGRKLQEALLTMLLEQQLDKRRILELYLNVVELGPGLYGVGDAAQYYFATPARALTLGQSLYLASLLPNPTYSRFGPDGKLKAGWLGYLHKLMHIAHKIRRIDDVELQAALEEEIAFRVPGAATEPALSPSDSSSSGDGPPELGDDNVRP
jgi:hypothetical protein